VRNTYEKTLQINLPLRTNVTQSTFLILSWKDKHQPLNTICGLHYGFLAPIHNLFPAVTVSKIYENLESTEGLGKPLEFCLLAYSLSLINNWWTICGKHMDKITSWLRPFTKVTSLLLLCLLCTHDVKTDSITSNWKNFSFHLYTGPNYNVLHITCIFKYF
jgi:hypothetical protein